MSSNGDEEQSAKRQKREEEAEVITPTDTNDGARTSTHHNSESSNLSIQPDDVVFSAESAAVASLEEGDRAVVSEECCVLCLQGADEKPLLDSHGCSRCSKDAWKICVDCNNTRLSRECPICRGDYAPIVLTVIPGDPLIKLADKSLSAEARTNLLYKFGIIRNLVGKSNVAVWDKDKKVMHFSLPQEFVDGGDKEFKCLCISVPLCNDDGIKNNDEDNGGGSGVGSKNIEEETSHSRSGTSTACAAAVIDEATQQFSFTNKTWDKIEYELEHGTDEESTNNEMLSSQAAIGWILAKTKERGAVMLTMMSAADWDYMLDPSKSVDTQEALKAIREGLVDKKMTAATAAVVADK